MSSSPLKLDLKSLKLPSWLGGGGLTAGGASRVHYPPVAMALGADSFALVRLAKDRKTKTIKLASQQVVDVPADLIGTEVFQLTMRDPARMTDLVSGAIGRSGGRAERISLVLPDYLARVALLHFEDIPGSRKEMIGMVRWKMKKAVPFKVEEAAVDYEILPGPGPGGGHAVLAVLMPLAIVEEHESFFTRQGIRAGLIDLSTFCIARLYRPVVDTEVPPGGDFMLINAGSCFLAAMIFRGGVPIFYRCKTFGFGQQDDPAGSLKILHREIQASLLYYQERLDGRQLSRVYMALVGHDPERVAGLFQGAPVEERPELVDPRRVIEVDPATGGDDVMQRLAPAIGAALGNEFVGRAA